MQLTFDRDTNTAYLELTRQHSGDVCHSIVVEDGLVAGEVILDVDAAGRVIGIDIGNATRLLPPDVLSRAVRRP